MIEIGQIRKLSLCFMACFLLVVTTIAQKPGDKVEYKAQNWPEKWEVGTFVKELPGGTQVLIAEKPTEFFPDGSQKAYSRADVRPIKTTPQADNPPKNPKQPPVDEPDADGDADGGGLMSEQDVLSFLQTRLGNGDPFRDNPKRERALQALREEILRRGVGFRYTSIGDFSNKLGKYGALSNVTAPLTENYGALAKASELYGTWRFAKVGAPGNPRFANSGSMTISANGNYVWNTASGVLKGKWRKATADEMAKSDKGGEGIVLIGAKDGLDWLLFKRNESGPQGVGVKVTDLGTRNMRERGTR